MFNNQYRSCEVITITFIVQVNHAFLYSNAGQNILAYVAELSCCAT